MAKAQKGIASLVHFLIGIRAPAFDVLGCGQGRERSRGSSSRRDATSGAPRCTCQKFVDALCEALRCGRSLCQREQQPSGTGSDRWRPSGIWNRVLKGSLWQALGLARSDLRKRLLDRLSTAFQREACLKLSFASLQLIVTWVVLKILGPLLIEYITAPSSY